jgi:TolA-binding protein
MFSKLILLPALIALSGCVSYWRGQEMDAEIKALEGRIDSQIEDLRGLRQNLQEDLVKVAAQLMQTEKKLVESIERLQTGNADNMVIIEQLREELNTARGELARIEHTMKDGPTALPDAAHGGAGGTGGDGGAAAPAGPALSEDPAELYRYGYERKQAGTAPRPCAPSPSSRRSLPTTRGPTTASSSSPSASSSRRSTPPRCAPCRR